MTKALHHEVQQILDAGADYQMKKQEILLKKLTNMPKKTTKKSKQDPIQGIIEMLNKYDEGTEPRTEKEQAE